MKVLVIKSSITGDFSHTNKKIDELVADYKQKGYDVVVRDVAQTPVPLFDANLMKGFRGDQEFAKEVQFHNELIEEALTADEFVIGAPMYNFAIPVQLKAYLDSISRSGKTFKYSETGVVGLLKAKKFVAVSARGGYLSESGYNNMEEYLKYVFNFLGVKESKFVLIEGVSLGEDKVKVSEI